MKGVSLLELGEQPLFAYGSATMLAGIDPEAEAKMVGLDQSTKSATHSRYFKTDDSPVDMGNDVYQIPILLNQREYVDAFRTYKYEKVDLPLQDDSINTTMEQVIQKGGYKYLNTLSLSNKKNIQSHDFGYAEDISE